MHRLGRGIERSTQDEFGIRRQDLFLLYRIKLLLQSKSVDLCLFFSSVFVAVGKELTNLPIFFKHGVHTAMGPFFDGDAFGFTITHRNVIMEFLIIIYCKLRFILLN